MSESQGSWELNGTTLEYKVNSKVVATVAGLNTTDENITSKMATAVTGSGTAADPYVIELSSDVLNEAAVKLKVTKGYSAKLALAEDAKVTISKAEVDRANVASGGKATIKGDLSVGYMLTSTTDISYNATEQPAQPIAEVSGLAKTAEAASAISVDSDGSVVTLSKDALGATGVTLVQKNGSECVLGFADDGYNYSAHEEPGYWTAGKKGTATFNIDTTPNYKLADNKLSIAYTKGYVTNVATVKGLTSAIANTAKGSNTGNEIVSNILSTKDAEGNPSEDPGVTVEKDGKAYTFTFSNNILAGAGSATVVPNTKGGFSATLDIDDSVLTEDIENVTKWFVSGTTATYKTVKPAHYKVENGAVVFVAQKDVTVYAVLNNLKSGLKVAEDFESSDGCSLDSLYDENGKEVLRLDGKKITVTKDALTTKSVTFNSKYATAEDAAEYTLALAGDYRATIKDTPTWAVSKGKAVYSANLTDGYTLAIGGRTINYIGATKKPTSLVEISGLKNTLTAANIAEVVTIANDTKDSSIDKLLPWGTVTLLPGALTNSSVTITKGDYSLDLSDDVVTKDNVETENLWSYSVPKGSATGTATYDQYTFDHYDLSDTAKVAVYTAYGKTANLATLEGISKDLKLSDEVREDGIITNKAGETIVTKAMGEAPSETVISATDDEETITLKNGALVETVTATLTSSDYTIASIEEDDKIEQPQESLKWVPNGTIAYLKESMTAGYTLSTNGKKISHSNEILGDTIAKLEGIKDGLEVGEDANGVTALGTYDKDGNFTAAVTVNSTDNKLTLKNDALDAGDVKVSGSGGYQLELDDKVPAPNTGNSTAWKVSGDTLTLVGYESKGWEEVETSTKVGKTTVTGIYDIKYTAAEEKAPLATITGLKGNLKVNDDGSIDGIEVDAENGTITLSSDVLNMGDVKITNRGTNKYELKLGGDVDEFEVTPTGIYNDKKKTFTYTEKVEKPGYQIDADGNIIYKASTTDTTTISNVTGLDNSFAPAVKDDGSRVFELYTSNIASNGNVTLTTGKNNKYNLDYQLELKYADKAIETVNVWKKTPKDTKATYSTITVGYTLAKDGKSITYSSEKNATVLATISGLKKDGVEATLYKDPTTGDIIGENKIEGITIEGDTIKLDRSVLGDNDVTLGANDAYTLSIELDDCKPTDVTSLVEFNSAKGIATISKGTKKGWTIADSKKLSYTKPALTTLATIKGLPKTLVVEDNVLSNSDGDPVITVTEPTTTQSGILTVNRALIDEATDIVVKGNAKAGTDPIYGLKGISLGKNDNYIFEFATGDDDAPAPDEPTINEDSKGWSRVKNGIIAYKANVSDGYVIAANKKSLSYTPATVKTLAQISGLNAKVGVDGGIIIDKAVDIDKNNVITVSKAALEGVTKEVKLTGDDSSYTLALDEDVDKPEPLSEPKWTVKGTTATLKEGTTAGYSVTNGGKSIAYSTAAEGKTLAVISGLAKGLKPDENGQIPGVNVYAKTIGLETKVLGTTNVTLTSDFYTFDTANIKPPKVGQATWVTNNGTAVLQQSTEGGFTISEDQKTLTYTPTKTNATLVTVAGLDKSFNINSDESVITCNNNVITINNAALGTNKVYIKEKNSPYSLKLGNDVATSTENLTGWVTSGTTATYKNYDKEYYNIDDKTGAIIYNKPVDKVIKATISGIKSGAVIDEDALDGKVITLTEDNLGTAKVTLKDNEGAGYTLALGRKVKTVKVVDGEATWDTPANKTTATLTGNLTEGYALSADKKTITYSTAKKDQKLATVSGLKTGVDIKGCVKDNVITLGKDQLTTSSVALKVSAGDDYTLAVKYDNHYETEGAINEVKTESTTWTTNNKAVATLTGVITAGYTLSDDAKTITYSKANAKASLATVAGLKSSSVTLTAAAVDTENKTVSLTGEQLSDTVSVSGTYKFDIAADYTKGTVNGSKNADNITVHGFNVTVNGGKGDDVIDLGSTTRDANEANTFVYSNGDGNDVITNFSTSDVIKVTQKAAKVSLATSGNDLVLKVNNNTITLKDKASNGFVYVDQTGSTRKPYVVASADLLYDDTDNFITADSQLGDITNDAFSAYSLDEDLTSAQNLKTLTKQSTLVTYGNDKK